MRILVTGASGFVGSALVRHLATSSSYAVRASLRDSAGWDAPAAVEVVRGGALDAHTDWRAALAHVDVVVHCAARVHVMQEKAADPLQEFRRCNVDGTLNLARQAQAAGVKRFVFLSSIKVNGEHTRAGHPFTADDIPAPADPYGISKLEAEQGLLQLARQGAMDVTIIRPVLIYGPGVKANFLSMMRWVRKGIPLPLGAVTHNRRSIVALDNLVDLITVCLHHPAARNQVFLVSDGTDLSTAELLTRIARALGVPSRLLPVPLCWLQFAAAATGKRSVMQRLCGSLQVNQDKTLQLLQWHPPASTDAALRALADVFSSTNQSK
ncbi:SDR family oxidoreductase [Herbaspirillum sp. DW155]|uniref:UDP-glucose 4-epimerase family protein n=1 Tax=Herbaspirillum sp. DW155 TaxID=3095609 RepID=UPI0030CB2370